MSTARDEQRDAHGSVLTAPHPRGAGFRVLSRIARIRADEDDNYAPRHRLDIPVETVTHASAAS